ncbi:MAG: hypothetical protein ACJAW3_000766 [Lentimonas sp.]|jgi:hypothetical protein
MKNSLIKTLTSCFFLIFLPLSLQAKNFSDIEIEGFIDSTSGIRSQESSYNKATLPESSKNQLSSNPDFTGEAELHLKFSNITEFNLEYGAAVELDATFGNATENNGFDIEKAFIFAKSDFGKFEVGSNSSANLKMKVGTEKFARGAGGINGKYLQYINLPMLGNSANSANPICAGGVSDAACSNIKLPQFILIPQSPIAHGGSAKGFYSDVNQSGFNKNDNGNEVRDGQISDLADAVKINYYSPRIASWKLGLSLTPDTGNNANSHSISGKNGGNIKQVIGLGLNYSNSFGNVGLAFSATGEVGKFKNGANNGEKKNDLKAYDLGIMTTYLGFTIGASYGNWGDSLEDKYGINSCNYDESLILSAQNCSSNNLKFNDATYKSAGIAYQFGPFATSLTYLKSNFQENEYQALSFGIDYKMTKGLMPYFEVTKYEFTSNKPRDSIEASSDQLKDNEGFVGLVGLLFSF